MDTPSPIKPPAVAPAKKRQVPGFVRALLKLSSLLFLFSVLGLLLLDMFVPGTPERAVLREMGTVKSSVTHVLGVRYALRKATVTTDDFRKINAELIVPENAGNAELPLVIINSAFMRNEDVMAMMGPTGNNAILIYTPDELYNMYYGVSAAEPSSGMMRALWEKLRLNPVNRWVNMYIGLNRTASDIVRLVDWARETANIDIRRVNLVGLGIGCLSTTQAALALERIGLPPRTLTLVFPPADLTAAVAATYGHNKVSEAFGLFNEFMLRRMLLTQTLPLVNIGQKLLIVPSREFEIPTYAVEPVIPMARSGGKTVRWIDIEYEGWNVPKYIKAIRDDIYVWLLKKNAIEE